MKKRFWITFLVASLCFFTLFVKAGPYILDRDLMASNEGTEENLKAQKIIDEKGEIAFLLMGIDDEYKTGGVEKVKRLEEDTIDRYVTTGLRSDTMILCKFNFDTGETTMFSIPRDTRTAIMGREHEEKINHAHSYGGPNLSVDTVNDLLGVDVNYYVTVDYRAVKELVDAIGGVDIYVPQNMNYTDPVAKPPLYINLKEGQQTLDGDKSLQFLRFRSYREGDLGRVHAQQAFLKAFATEMLKPSNIVSLPKMVKTYFDYVDTNIPFSVVMKGIASAPKVDMDELKVVTLPGDGQYIGNVSYFLHDEEAMKPLVREHFSHFLTSNSY